MLYSVDLTSPFHAAADRWLTDALNGSRRVGLPWMSLTAFVRIATNPRAARQPLTPAGPAIVSADSDFARFTELTWLNPIAPPAR